MLALLTTYIGRQLAKALIVLFWLGSGQLTSSLSSVFHNDSSFSSGQKNIYPIDKQKIQVIVFLDSECPISQKYTRRLAELHGRYAPAGVEFTGLYPSPTDTPKTIRRFRQEYKLPFAGKPDTQHAWVNRYKARITPEVVVLSQEGIVVYQGAIDDWFVALGKNRREPTRHYLQETLDALISGHPILTSKTEAIGCLISERVKE